MSCAALCDWLQSRGDAVGKLEETILVDEIFVDEFPPFIEYLEIGECADMLGGPATRPGWYLHPECMVGCCESAGPFPTKAAAVETDRVLREQFREASRKRRTSEFTLKEIEPF